MATKDSTLMTDGLLIGVGVLLVCRALIWILSRRKYPPGPIGLPLVGYLPFLGAEPHKTLWQMRQKYGDIIGLYFGNTYTVVLNSYRVTKEVLTHPGSLDRAPNLFDHVPDSGFLTANGEKWTEQRRFCMNSAKTLGLGKGQWEETIMESVSDFIQEIRATNGVPTDLTRTMKLSINTNLISLLIGRHLNKDKEADIIEQSLFYSDAIIRYMGPASAVSLVPGLRKLLVLFKIAGYDKAAEVIGLFKNFFRKEIERHKSSKDATSSTDFINTYLQKLDEVKTSGLKDHYFSEKMLSGNITLLYIAANDTTDSSLTWVLRLMAKHRDIQDKVYKELTEVLGKELKASYGDRKKFPYTFAVLLEAQRVSSSVALSTTRRANRDIEIDGYVIPKGAEITSNLWGLHHDPAYWDKPDQFIPERFLAENGTKIIANLPSYAPFSIGKRDCPGQAIAYISLMAYFTEIIRNFEVTTAPGVEADFTIIQGLVNTLEHQELCFKPRDNL